MGSTANPEDSSLDGDETLPRDPRAKVGPSIAPPPVNPGIGSLDGSDEARYKLERKLGTGSMGEVRLCKDERVGREVALKVILPEHRADAQIRARFLREARVQGQLEHPSIVPLYDLGVGEDGGLYFTMKCLRGLTLAQIVRSLREGDPEVTRQFSRRKLLTTFSSVCLTIDFAHSRGVLHRDLKPSNVMLGSYGEVYVLDWGIAKLREEGEQRAKPVIVEEDSGEELQTAAGKALGTFGYMSPEQVLGRIGDLDARTDVYALGAILFEILTLQPLHPRTTWSAMLGSTLKGGNTRPRERAPDLDISPEIDAICVKATMVEPKHRFQSARELHEAVERFLDGDRDVELRRQMVTEHARAAEEASARALLGGEDAEEARRAALQHAGRTLTLDPTNRTAMLALGQVLAATPSVLPKEVAEEIDRTTAARYRLQFKEGVRFDIAGALLLGPIAVWMGIRQGSLLLFAIACVLISMLFKVLGARRQAPSGWAMYGYGGYLFNVLALVAMSRSFGPLFFSTALLAVFTFAYSMSYEGRYRMIVLTTGVLALLGPIVAEYLEIVPRSYAFHIGGALDGAMTILPQAVTLPAVPTLCALTLANLFIIVGPALMMGKLQRSLRNADQRSILQSWHLRRLLPDEASAPVTGPPPA